MVHVDSEILIKPMPQSIQSNGFCQIVFAANSRLYQPSISSKESQSQKDAQFLDWRKIQRLLRSSQTQAKSWHSLRHHIRSVKYNTRDMSSTAAWRLPDLPIALVDPIPTPAKEPSRSSPAIEDSENLVYCRNTQRISLEILPRLRHLFFNCQGCRRTLRLRPLGLRPLDLVLQTCSLVPGLDVVRLRKHRYRRSEVEYTDPANVDIFVSVRA